MSRVIGLTGAKGSGKDLVGALIRKNYSNVRTIAYADPIKQVVQGLFGLDASDHIEYDAFKRTDVTFFGGKKVSGRALVREIGMLMRGYDEQQFVRYVNNNIAENPSALWVVTDVRFDNEIHSLKSLGAYIIEVCRPGVEYDGHATETGFANHLIDFQIQNDRAVDQLELKVVQLMDYLGV